MVTARRNEEKTSHEGTRCLIVSGLSCENTHLHNNTCSDSSQVKWHSWHAGCARCVQKSTRARAQHPIGCEDFFSKSGVSPAAPFSKCSLHLCPTAEGELVMLRNGSYRSVSHPPTAVRHKCVTTACICEMMKRWCAGAGSAWVMKSCGAALCSWTETSAPCSHAERL